VGARDLAIRRIAWYDMIEINGITDGLDLINDDNFRQCPPHVTLTQRSTRVFIATSLSDLNRAVTSGTCVIDCQEVNASVILRL
jgi:hypothetical protein